MCDFLFYLTLELFFVEIIQDKVAHDLIHGLYHSFDVGFWFATSDDQLDLVLDLLDFIHLFFLLITVRFIDRYILLLFFYYRLLFFLEHMFLVLLFHQLGCTYYRTKRDWAAAQKMLNRKHNDETPAEYYHVPGFGVSARHN